MIDNIAIGDEVLTAGGFFATVLEVADDEVTVELSPGARRDCRNARSPPSSRRRPQMGQPPREPTGQTPS